MSDFERFLLPPETDDLDPAIWGPAPTDEEVARVETWNNERTREHIKQVADELLPGCVDTDGLRTRYGINLDFDKHRLAVRSGHLLGFDFNTTEGTSLWFPSWQFAEQDAGTYVRNETLLDLWRKRQCVQGINFCYFVKQHSGAETFEQIPERLEDPDVVAAIIDQIQLEWARAH